MTPPPSLFFTDLDGTLLHSGALSSENRRALEELALRSIPRVLVTGRSLFGVRQTLPADFPIDFLIFSCGAGVLDWKTGELLVSHSLQVSAVQHIWKALQGLGLNFMVQDEVPRNHHFVFVPGSHPPEDFSQRLIRWEGYHQIGKVPPPQASQFLVVADEQTGPGLYQDLVKRFQDLTVVRATSPVDGKSTWIEIFPPQVSKGLGAQWLAARLGVETEDTMAVGNDYNDLTLLDWVAHPYVVGNAPSELLARFLVVNRFEDSGVAQAIFHWLGGRVAGL